MLLKIHFIFIITHTNINIHIYFSVFMLFDYFYGAISTKLSTNELKTQELKAIIDQEVVNK